MFKRILFIIVCLSFINMQAMHRLSRAVNRLKPALRTAQLRGGTETAVRKLQTAWFAKKPQPQPAPEPIHIPQDLEQRDAQDLTPLMQATQDGDAEKVNALLAAGANARASVGGKSAIVLAKDALTKARTNNQQFSMDEFNKRYRVVETFDKYTPRKSRNTQQEQQEDYYRYYNQKKVVQNNPVGLLIAMLILSPITYWLEPEEKPHTIIRASEVDLHKLEKTIKSNHKLIEYREPGGSGATPLITAARWGRNGAIHILLKCNANINAADYRGDTALHIAVFHRHTDVVKTLLEHGADATIKNRNGKIAFDYAMMEGYKGRVKEIIVLLEKAQKQ